MQKRLFFHFHGAKSFRWAGVITAAAALASMLALGGCSEYYYQPPPITVIITQPSNSPYTPPPTIPLASTDANGNIVATQIQCKAVVQNLQSGQSSTVTWAIQDSNPNDGPNYLKACPQFPQAGSTCATLGTITPDKGVYTSPTLLPSFNTIMIMAIPAADPSRFSTSAVTLDYPTANISSVSPSFLTAGASYTLDLKGQFFYPATAVTVSGAQTSAPTAVNPNQIIPFNELQAPVQVTFPGLLEVNAANPNSVGLDGQPNTGSPALVIAQPSSPSASTTIAVQIEETGTTPDPNNPGGTLPVYANTAFVPLTSFNELAVVNADSGTTLNTSTGQPVTISLPSGFAPTAAAANPAHNTVAVISATTPALAVVDATQDTVAHTYPIPVSGIAKFSDGSCSVCAVVVDSIRNLAVLDTASGYMTMDLSSGQTSTVMSAPVSENFAYDPTTQNVYIPYYNSSSGMDVLNLASGKLSSYVPANGSSGLGIQPDSTAYDLTTGIALTADENSSNYTLTNFNLASAGNGQVTAPSLSFAITSACGGEW